MIWFFAFFIFVFTFVLFGFIDLYLRQRSGVLLLSLDANVSLGKFDLEQEYEEIELYLTTEIRGGGFKSISGEVEVTLTGPLQKTVLFQDDNKTDRGTVMCVKSTERKSLGKLPLGEYGVMLKKTGDIKIHTLELRAQKKKYWLSAFTK